MSKTLEVRGLLKVYQGRGRSVEALRDLTFFVEASELVCVVGPSGCGKTTLLRCIAGLLEPTAGEVLVEGTRVAGPPPGMAVVFQEYGRSLFPWMSVRANVELPLRAKRGQRRDELVSDVLLMDEPFAAVDAQTRAELEDLVRAVWHRTGVTILFVTHDIDEAVYLGQRVLVLSSSPTSSRRTSSSICLTSGTSSPPARIPDSPGSAPTSTPRSSRPSVAETRRRRRHPRGSRLLRAARRRP